MPDAPDGLEIETRGIGDILQKEASALGVPLDAPEAADFDMYCSLILEQRGRMNLTGIKSGEGIVRELFLDSLLLVPAIDRVLPIDEPAIADVGSGAGIPGIPIAIARRNWSVTLIESTGKKARFIDTVIQRLELANCRIRNERVEDIERLPEYRDAFDCVTARALAPLPALLELCAPLVNRGGVLIFPKSPGVRHEIASADAAAAALNLTLSGIETLPSARGRPTTIVGYTKSGNTPSRFPRATGMAQSHPIEA